MLNTGSLFLKRFILIILILSCKKTDTISQQSEDAIRLNQTGFYPKGPKEAAVITEKESRFFLVNTGSRDTVFSGTLSEPRQSPYSKKYIRLADFSTFSKSGTYVLVVPGLGSSYAFKIEPDVHLAAAKGSLKAFYYIRASAEILSPYGGKWKRLEGHPDTVVEIHPSAASPERPAGTIIAAPRGWYDAGDYNKYIVNSGITTGTLLSAYEDFPEFFRKFSLNIPESNNKAPDILDEIIWNLRWMLAMQDPHDGGVYNKLTTANFEGMVMPDKATAKRYVIQKGTAAALDFAAVTAQASRILKKFNNVFPGLSDSCLIAAKKAWAWAQKNPDMSYNQREVNNNFDPDINTGGYGDRNFSDEFIWAACELYVTTGDENYYKSIAILPADKLSIPSWNQVKLLGFYTLLRSKEVLTPAAKKDLPEVEKAVIEFVDGWSKQTSVYNTVMGQTERDFHWGSNSLAANQGIALLQAYRLTKNKKYINLALSNLDYLMGKNGTGYSFITGFGSKTPMHPHHRPSEADGIDDPVPGLLAGGPNPGQQDRCQYPSSVPDESYVDDVCSYASNEIAINWNAPLVYLLCGMEALKKDAGYVSK